MSKKIILVTGASSGFGRLSAEALAGAGHTVYASMRDTKGRNAPNVKAIGQLAKEQGIDLRTVELDVQSQDSVDKGVAQLMAESDRIDVLIHNAGHMVFGPAEAFTPEQFAELYDVNVLSTQRVNRAVLPHLRRQKQGLLVWVSSSSSAGGTPPYLAPYFAAKAATTSRIRESLPTSRSSPNTRPVPMRALGSRCKRRSLRSYRPMQTLRRWLRLSSMS